MEELLERLSCEGKIVSRDQLSDQVMIDEMNADLREMRRDFQKKERESEIAASKMILTS